MNYLLLSLCCMLIGFTLGQPSPPTAEPNNPQDSQPDDTSDRDEMRNNCIREMATFLGKISLDGSVEKLVEKSHELGLRFVDFMAAEFIPLKGDHDRALQTIGYPESCDRILNHFSEMTDKVECFREQSMGTVLDYVEILEIKEAADVVWAGLACSYSSKWKTANGDAPSKLFEFSKSSKEKKDCINQTADSLREVTLHKSIEKLVKLTRESHITVTDFSKASSRPLDQSYSDAVRKIDPEVGCDHLFEQLDKVEEDVKCHKKYIQGDFMAYVELSTRQEVADLVLAIGACYLGAEQRQRCNSEVAAFLGGITLDQQVEELVERARKPRLTYLHLEAAMYTPLDDEYNAELQAIEYPKGCDKIVEQFSDMGEKVKCSSKDYLNILDRWIDSTKMKQFGDVVFARSVCGYLSKLKGMRPEVSGAEHDQPSKPDELSESEQKRKDCIVRLAELFRGIKLDSTVENLVKPLHACKATSMDFVLADYQSLPDECSNALVNLKERCKEFSKRIEEIKNEAQFYKEELDADVHAVFELQSLDGMGDIILLDEACQYIERTDPSETSEP